MGRTKLRSIRQRLGLTQVELARVLDVASNTVARWERGELSMPAKVKQRLEEIAAEGRSGSAITRPRGIVGDPHHRAILEGLQGHMDPEVFEACAVELIRQSGWPVVPVQGGKDDGFDGAVADGAGEPIPVVITTNRDLLRNLQQSLQRVRSQGWTVNRSMFATSRPISGGTRRKLYEASRQIGIPLVQTFDQDWFANRLYETPSWCKSLLGLTGRPRALSVFPITQRPVLGDAILGRARDMQWLLGGQGDCLLIGTPASGKTFLLRSLALQGDALFLVDGDREKIANDLRELQPNAVIIDDAHVHLEFVEIFAQLRQEVNASHIRIIASCWPGHASAVSNVLQITNRDVHELDLLDADTIVEVIKSVGLQGPDELLAIIRQQAAGRPGLAATLAHLCLSGDVKQVASGEALVNRLVPQLDRMLDVDAKRLLAPFALGGNAGMAQDSVGQYLGTSILEVSGKLARLAAAGIVREIPTLDMNQLASVSVEPAPMRWTLVRDIFFGGVGALDYRPLLERTGNRHEVVKTLIGARIWGASIPNLLNHIKDIGSAPLWSEYALIGPSECQYVIENHPELIMDIAQCGLMLTPETIIPKLLDSVRTEDYEYGTGYRGAIREFERWAVHISPTTSIEEVFHRRSMLVQSTERWWRDTQRHIIAIHMMCLALKPSLDYSKLDPGAGNTLQVVTGTYPAELLERLTELWPAVMRVVSGATTLPCLELFNLIRTWLREDPDTPLPPETRLVMRTFAERMLLDIADTTCERPGVQHLLRNQFSQLYPDLGLTLDEDFEAIYPISHSYSIEKHIAAADRIASRLGGLSIGDVAALLGRINVEARFAGFQSSGPLLSTACTRLADRVSDPLVFAEAFVQQGLPGDVVQPFLAKAALEDQPGWVSLVNRCLDEHLYEQSAVSVIMMHHSPPHDLLSAAILKAEKMVDVVEGLCLGGRVTDVVVEELFRTECTRVASAAAIAHWHARPHGSIDEPLKGLWRDAILRAAPNQFGRTQMSHYWLGEILSSDGGLARDWLIAGLRREERWSLVTDEETVQKAMSAMDSEQRCMVLNALPVGLLWPPKELARLLVGEDISLYSALLNSPSLTRYHLAPLAGIPDDAWVTKALLALDAGYSSSDIVSATTAAGKSWIGDESKMWAEWRNAFEKVGDKVHPDNRMLEIARLGVEIMTKAEQAAKDRERHRAVHGFSSMMT